MLQRSALFRPCLGMLAATLLGLSNPAAPATADDAGPLDLRQIAPGAYVHQGAHEEMSATNLGGIANLGVIVGEEAVAVIDSGGSARQGAQLLAAIRGLTDLPVRYVINTHMHPDHVFGNSAFTTENAQIVGHAKLPRALAARGGHYLDRLRADLGGAADGTEVIAPDITVEDRLELDLGGRPLVLTAHPTAHSDNDLTVLDRASGTLWLGDLLFVNRVPVVDGSLKGWLEVMTQLRAVPAARAVPGHGPAVVPWPAGLEDQGRYLKTLLDEIRGEIAANRTMEHAIEVVGESERGRWLLFDAYHPRNVVTGFAELEWE